MNPTIALDISVPLDRFTLEVRWQTSESSLGLFGHSGAGKTTLLEVIAGLRPSARGLMRFNGETWLDSRRGEFVPPERRGIGYVPQDALLFPHLNVRENLLFGRGRLRPGGADGVSVERVQEVLELGPLGNRAIATLSGGERQRVALGRALCSAPRLLLLDEPLAGLDIPLRRRILPYLLRVREAFAVPTIYVSHEIAEVRMLSREVLVLSEGREVARGPADQVFLSPAGLTFAHEQGLENLISGRVLPESGTTCRVEIEPGLRLAVAGSCPPPGSQVVVGVRAEDIILAISPPGGVSAQNILPGVVQHVRAGASQTADADQILVEVAVAGSHVVLVAMITREALHRLGLADGTPVHLICKANSCRLVLAR